MDLLLTDVLMEWLNARSYSYREYLVSLSRILSSGMAAIYGCDVLSQLTIRDSVNISVLPFFWIVTKIGTRYGLNGTDYEWIRAIPFLYMLYHGFALLFCFLAHAILFGVGEVDWLFATKLMRPAEWCIADPSKAVHYIFP